MAYNIPQHINSEKDLEKYEMYIENNHNLIDSKTNHKFILTEYLKSNIGKQIKVNVTVGNRTAIYSGILSDTGLDFIIITAFEKQCNIIIPLNKISYLIFLPSK